MFDSAVLLVVGILVFSGIIDFDWLITALVVIVIGHAFDVAFLFTR